MLPQWISSQAESKNTQHSSCYSLTKTLPVASYHVGKVPRLYCSHLCHLIAHLCSSFTPPSHRVHLDVLQKQQALPLLLPSVCILRPRVLFLQAFIWLPPLLHSGSCASALFRRASLTSQSKMVSSSQTFLSLLGMSPSWHIPLLDILLSICWLFVFLLEYEHHQASVFFFCFFLSHCVSSI